MNGFRAVLLVAAGLPTLAVPCWDAVADEQFPPELVDFEPYRGNPVFAGTGKDTWDRTIRERGYILREGGTWHLLYTGYNHNRSDANYCDTMSLGYATSPDGLQWTRHGDTYYMFAEGLHDIAHMLTSADRVHWRDHGRLDVRQSNGRPIGPGPYGTPTVWVERDRWYLFYERGDRGIWLATSTDRKVWTNVQDDPVIRMGPEAYDKQAVAMNQIIKFGDRYYAYYHACAHQPWRDWSTNVAVSTDLVHWIKYPDNPIVSGNKSSGSLVHDGRQYRLYTAHPDVRVYFPKNSK